jgi:hypothetical protein
MKEIIGKIGRQNHLNHLQAVMPVITFVFGLQCFFIYKFAEGVDIGDYALMLGSTLAAFIGFLAYYDLNHHVFICKKHLRIYFALTGKDLEIPYQDIHNILTPEEECNFASIIIQTKDNKNHVIYFVDYPLTVKQIIEEQMKASKEDLHNSFSDAA